MSVWTIILAAGSGSRFGGPKALANWEGQTLLERAVSVAAQQKHVVIVTGAHAEIVEAAARTTPTVHNQNWEAGMGSSIAVGLAYAARNNASMALIVPVDQPFITADDLHRLVELSSRQDRCVLTQDNNIVGPPAAIPARFFESLFGLTDKGLKSYLPDYGLCVAPGVLRDIDTPADLERLTKIR